MSGNGSMSPSEMGMTVPPLIAAASALCTSGSVYFLRASGGMSRSVRSFLRLGVPSSFGSSPQDVVWEIINLFVLSSRSRLCELHLRQCFVVSR